MKTAHSRENGSKTGKDSKWIINSFLSSPIGIGYVPFLGKGAEN